VTTIVPIRIGSVSLPGRVVGSSSEVEELGVWSFLVKSSGVTALIDVGLPPVMTEIDSYVHDQLGNQFGYEGANKERLEYGLAQFDTVLSDIDVVILTHLHHDHSGGLVWLSGPEVWCHREERELLTGRYSRWLGPEWQITGEIRARFESLEEAGRLRWWSGTSVTVNSDVEARWVGGHTPGSSGVLIQTQDGVTAILGDLLLTEEEVLEGRVSSLTIDMRETVDGMREMVSRADALWTGHAHDGPVSARIAQPLWGKQPLTEVQDCLPTSAHDTGHQGPKGLG
jgi:glyoxylase-like metal-dependent hydrolase (beta-lactamase superfamily II)